MHQELMTIPWTFWLLWALAFLGFPLGGLLASVTVGPVTNVWKAALAGALTGGVLGTVQYFAINGQIEVFSIEWITATAAGLAVGLALSVALLKSEMDDQRLLWRAAITGLSVGAAQWLAMRQMLPRPESAAWIAVVGLGWVLGWFITRRIGVDLKPKWTVFGAAGALAFQLLSGLALYFLLG